MNQQPLDSNALQAISYGVSSLVAEIVTQKYFHGRLAPEEWEDCSDTSNEEVARKIRRMLTENQIPERDWPEIFRRATLWERIVTDASGYISSYLCSASEPGITTLVPPVPDSGWKDSMYDERDDESNFYATQAKDGYPEGYHMECRKVSLEEFCENYGIKILRQEEPTSAPRM